MNENEALADISTISEATESISNDPIHTETDVSEEQFSLEAEAHELSAEFPVLEDGAPESHFNTERYEELRALGVTPREAFLATVKPTAATDDRAHLGGSVPRRARVGSSGMSVGELREARTIFGGMSDEEIRDLYRRVTK